MNQYLEVIFTVYAKSFAHLYIPDGQSVMPCLWLFTQFGNTLYTFTDSCPCDTKFPRCHLKGLSIFSVVL